MSKQLEARVRSAQVDSLYRHSNTYVVFHPVAALLFVWTFSSELAAFPVALWLAIVCVLAAVRYVCASFFHQGNKSHKQVLFWEHLFVLFGFTQACLYTLSWIYLLSANQQLTNALLGVWIVGLSACSIVGYSANLRGVFAFFIPVVFPASLYLLYLGGEFNLGIAAALLLYSFVIILALLPVNRSIKRSVRLNFDLQKEVENRRVAEQKLLELSRQDSLTSVANRRHFDLTLQSEIQRAARSQSPLTLVLLDIDYFKEYNDNYGHLAGDACLRDVAKLLTDHLNRSSDHVARYGGEEFALILPDTDKQQASALIESLQEKLAELNIAHSSTHVDDVECLTLSAGAYTAYPDENSRIEHIIEKADWALYEAKANGRNRAVCVL